MDEIRLVTEQFVREALPPILVSDSKFERGRLLLIAGSYGMAGSAILSARAALLSGLVLASAQALVVMYMPQETVEQLVSAVSESMKMSASQQEEMSGMMDRLPVLTFLFQWLYCFLYGTVLSGILSRYIFFQKLFGGPFDGPEDKQNTPDEQ